MIVLISCPSPRAATCQVFDIIMVHARFVYHVTLHYAFWVRFRTQPVIAAFQEL